MKILKNELTNKLNIRTQNDFPVKGIEFIDITPLIIQKETFYEITTKFVNEIQKYEIDYIIAPEARGFLFGTAIAEKLKIGFIPVRKKGKLPPSAVRCTFSYEKEYGKDELELPKLVDEDYNNKNFYIIDDIYATGNTMKSICSVVEKLGGNVIGKGVVMNIIKLNDDKDVFSLLDVEEE